MNPIHKYHQRYLEIKKDKNISSDSEHLVQLLQKDVSGLNNFFMAALGMSTLLLRLGAVIQLCRKFEQLDEQGDMLFSKQLLDNLRETMPSDTNWKKMWEVSAEEETWKDPTVKKGQKESLLSRFVTFRNRFVHQQIQLSESNLVQLQEAILLFDEMESLYSLLVNGELILQNDQFVWKERTLETNLHPYVQKVENSDQPYIFQGVHNKEKVHFLNTQLGDKIDQNLEEHINPLFEPIHQSLRNGAGQVFDHSSRIAYYQSCFVGREIEKELLLSFCKNEDGNNILTIKSPAGMGKGALLANLIDNLKAENIQTLYHFCGAGLHNSLHAVLYHFILQGKNGGYWKTDDEAIANKLQRLPSKYFDVIHLFQRLIDEQLNLLRKNTVGNIVIIIDALDEAQIASTQLKISDWFYTYNEKEEPEADWRSANNIRWVFTYRCAEDGSENFYKFPSMQQCATLEELQPLKGLSPDVVRDVFSRFKVSEEFLSTIIEKAEV